MRWATATTAMSLFSREMILFAASYHLLTYSIFSFSVSSDSHDPGLRRVALAFGIFWLSEESQCSCGGLGQNQQRGPVVATAKAMAGNHT